MITLCFNFHRAVFLETFIIIIFFTNLVLLKYVQAFGMMVDKRTSQGKKVLTYNSFRLNSLVRLGGSGPPSILDERFLREKCNKLTE